MRFKNIVAVAVVIVVAMTTLMKVSCNPPLPSRRDTMTLPGQGHQPEVSRSNKALSLPDPNENNLWYEISDDSKTVFVFVHGLTSDSRDCWWYRGDRDGHPEHQYWPHLVANDEIFDRPAVYLAGYYSEFDSGNYGFRDAARDIFERMNTPDSKFKRRVIDRENIIFVCHSLGGVVARQLLVDNVDEFANKKVGLVLIASPTLGSEWGTYLRAVANVLGNAQMQSLKHDSRRLLDLDEDFAELMDEGKLPRLIGAEAYENHFVGKQQFGLLATRTKEVVRRAEQGRHFGKPKLLSDTDHHSIAKPYGVDDQPHTFLQNFYLNKFLESRVVEPSVMLTEEDLVRIVRTIESRTRSEELGESIAELTERAKGGDHARIRLIIALLNDGQYQKALEWCNNADMKRLNGYDVYVTILAARCQRNLGEDRKALRTISRLIEALKPKLPQYRTAYAIAMLGRAFLYDNRSASSDQKARDDLKAVASAIGDPANTVERRLLFRCYFLLGNTHRKAGNYDLAIKSYERALGTNADSHDDESPLTASELSSVFSNRAGAFQLLASGHNISKPQRTQLLQKARRDFESANRHTPGSPLLMNSIAYLYATVKPIDSNIAIHMAEAACRLDEFNTAAYIDTLAAAYASDGRLNEAMEKSNLAISLSNDDVERKELEQRNRTLAQRVKEAE